LRSDAAGACRAKIESFHELRKQPGRSSRFGCGLIINARKASVIVHTSVGTFAFSNPDFMNYSLTLAKKMGAVKTHEDA
jgi:hypothetical protein